MIWDTLEHLNSYRSSLLHSAVDWLSTQSIVGDLANWLPEGTHKIQEEDLFVLVQKYETRDSVKALWESHQNYIDIQILLEGEEKVEVANICELTPLGIYDMSTDKFRYEGKGTLMTFKTGYFYVFFPWDAHRCGMHSYIPQQVLKYCLKVRYPSNI